MISPLTLRGGLVGLRESSPKNRTIQIEISFHHSRSSELKPDIHCPSRAAWREVIDLAGYTVEEKVPVVRCGRKLFVGPVLGSALPIFSPAIKLDLVQIKATKHF